MAAPPAVGQDQVTEGMTVKRVELEGLQTISEGFVRRIIKTRADQPFVRRQVLEDTRELLRTRKFLNVFATPRVEEGQVVVVFTLQEKPEIVSVELSELSPAYAAYLGDFLK